MKSLAEIVDQLQDFDPEGLKAEQVSAFLAEMVEPVAEVERVPLLAALDRVLAEAIISPISVPPHDNSAMDGFAFDGAQLQPGTPLRLRIVGTALAGKVWKGAVGEGECVKIMTGAVMPPGLDTVVPQEHTKQEDHHVVIPADTLRLGANRRHRGEDLTIGQQALAQGERLAPAALGLLAGLGLTQVPVYRRLRAAYFSTGDEILSPGEAPKEGSVYDSNRYTVLGMLTRLGCEVIDLGVVGDKPNLLEATLAQAASQADVIITSGGVSVGEADHTRKIMNKLGDVVFWRVAMRPGRPMAVGRIAKPESAHEGAVCKRQDTLLFGLPGNPVATMVTFLAFVRPALLRLMGARPQPTVLLRATCEHPISKKPGRTEYQRGIVTQHPGGRLTVRITGNQGSGILSSMVDANGLIVLEHEQGNVAAGDEVGLLMLES